MIVWLLMLGTGALYPIGCKDGTPGYTNKELAEKKAKMITKHDGEYVKSRGGLHTSALRAKESTLKALKVYPKYD